MIFNLLFGSVIFYNLLYFSQWGSASSSLYLQGTAQACKKRIERVCVFALLKATLLARSTLGCNA